MARLTWIFRKAQACTETRPRGAQFQDSQTGASHMHMPQPGVSVARAGWQVRLPMTFSSAQLRLSKSDDAL